VEEHKSEGNIAKT